AGISDSVTGSASSGDAQRPDGASWRRPVSADHRVVPVLWLEKPRTRCRAAYMADFGLVDVALEQAVVGVHAAVAQERPDAPHMLAALQVDLGEQHRRLATRLGDEFALRAQHVAVAPEVHAAGAHGRRLVADAIAGQHGQAVGDRVATVAQHPRVALAV